MSSSCEPPFVPRILHVGLILLTALATGPAVAEAAFSFGATPGKLPKTVAPIHYALDLTPDLDKLTFSGSEVVDIEVMEPTARLMLNAVEMTIEAGAIEGEAAPQVTSDAAAQTVTFTFPDPIAAGRHQLRVSFTGRINRFGRGLFMVDYPTAEGRKRMMSSHLEPSDARRIFPSWDEPAFKATIALTVTVPQAFLAVSNMPVAQEEPTGDGSKRVAFQPTPRMSSYLFVLAAGDLERTTIDVDGVTVGVVTTGDKGQHGHYALEAASELLRYFNDYFGIAYPLPKLDLIAVPGGFGGAMENWGGITFFESRLLFDPATSASDAQRGIFGIIAHEIANETEAMAAFDSITYAKGQAIIRMVENYLGEDAFRAGIRAYMRQHAYSNTTTADLWGALEAASGKPVA